MSPMSPTSAALAVKPCRYPVFFVLDLVEDCVIRDCSHLTLVVLCARNQILLENVHNAKVVCMGSYVVLSKCSAVEIYGYASKGALVEECDQINVFPLFIEAPCIDDIARAWAPDTGLIDPAGNLFGTPRLQVERSKRISRDSQGIFIFTLDVPALGASSKMLSSTKPSLRRVALTPYAGGSGAVSAPTGDATLPTVAFHHRNNISVLRLPRTLCPLRAASATEPSCNLTIDCVHTGVLHIADAVGTVIITNCKGPLEIVLCAAQRVVVANCDNILVQVACFSFECHSSSYCHFALLCNNQPTFLGVNTRIQLSALNITTADFEGLLERASILPELNLFSSPVVHGINVNDDEALLTADRSLETLEDAWLFLTRPISIVPPLQGVCVNADEVPFLEFVEDTVGAEEEKRVPFATLLSKAMTILGELEVTREDPHQQVASLRDDEAEAQALLPHHSASRSGGGDDSPSKRSGGGGTGPRGVPDSDERPPRPNASLGFRRSSDGKAQLDDGEDDDDDDDEDAEEGGSISPTRRLNASNDSFEGDAPKPQHHHQTQQQQQQPRPTGPSMRYVDESSSSSSSDDDNDDRPLQSDDSGDAPSAATCYAAATQQQQTSYLSDEGELEVCDEPTRKQPSGKKAQAAIAATAAAATVATARVVATDDGPSRSQGSPVQHGSHSSGSASPTSDTSPARTLQQSPPAVHANPLRGAVHWSSVATGAAETDAKLSRPVTAASRQAADEPDEDAFDAVEEQQQRNVSPPGAKKKEAAGSPPAQQKTQIDLAAAEKVRADLGFDDSSSSSGSSSDGDDSQKKKKKKKQQRGGTGLSHATAKEAMGFTYSGVYGPSSTSTAATATADGHPTRSPTAAGPSVSSRKQRLFHPTDITATATNGQAHRDPSEMAEMGFQLQPASLAHPGAAAAASPSSSPSAAARGGGASGATTAALRPNVASLSPTQVASAERSPARQSSPTAAAAAAGSPPAPVRDSTASSSRPRSDLSYEDDFVIAEDDVNIHSSHSSQKNDPTPQRNGTGAGDEGDDNNDGAPGAEQRSPSGDATCEEPSPARQRSVDRQRAASDGSASTSSSSPRNEASDDAQEEEEGAENAEAMDENASGAHDEEQEEIVDEVAEDEEEDGGMMFRVVDSEEPQHAAVRSSPHHSPPREQPVAEEAAAASPAASSSSSSTRTATTQGSSSPTSPHNSHEAAAKLSPTRVIIAADATPASPAPAAASPTSSAASASPTSPAAPASPAAAAAPLPDVSLSDLLRSFSYGTGRTAESVAALLHVPPTAEGPPAPAAGGSPPAGGQKAAGEAAEGGAASAAARGRIVQQYRRIDTARRARLARLADVELLEQRIQALVSMAAKGKRL